MPIKIQEKVFLLPMKRYKKRRIEAGREMP